MTATSGNFLKVCFRLMRFPFYSLDLFIERLEGFLSRFPIETKSTVQTCSKSTIHRNIVARSRTERDFLENLLQGEGQ